MPTNIAADNSTYIVDPLLAMLPCRPLHYNCLILNNIMALMNMQPVRVPPPLEVLISLIL